MKESAFELNKLFYQTECQRKFEYAACIPAFHINIKNVDIL